MLPHLLIGLVIVAMALAIVIGYYAYYTYTINRQLKDPRGKGKTLLSPASVGIMAIIGTLFAIFIATFAVPNPFVYEHQLMDEEYTQEYYAFEVYTPQQMQNGYLKGFSKESNVGYDKHEETVEDITFTYFVSQDSHDPFHPSFIIYAEYTGSNDILTYGYDATYFPHEEERVVRKGSPGPHDALYQDYLCIVGSTPMRSSFVFDLYYHDTEEAPDDSEKPEVAEGKNSRNAIAAGSLTIEIAGRD